jgi:hypothetical protein
MVVLALVRLLAAGLERIRIASLLPLLMLQFVLLSAFLAICIAADPVVDPNAAKMVIAGMLGVSAMAVQNAVVQISLKGTPSFRRRPRRGAGRAQYQRQGESRRARQPHRTRDRRLSPRLYPRRLM